MRMLYYSDMNNEIFSKKGKQKSLFISFKANSIIELVQKHTGQSYSEIVSTSIEYLDENVLKIANENQTQTLSRKDKIKKAIKKHFSQGQIIKTKEIIKIVQREYPNIPSSSILPADFCDNHKNKDPFSGKYHIFSKLDRGTYQVL